MRPLLLLLPVALSACNSDYQVKAEAKQLVVSPVLGDAGLLSVGATTSLDMILAAPKADVAILAVDLLNVDGDWFSLGDHIPENIPADEADYFSVTYTPEEEGYHWAQITIVTDEETDNEHVVTVRGAAVEGAARLWPSILDLGPVPTGTEATGTVTLSNEGAADLDLSAVNIVGAGFSLDDVLPISLASGEQIDLSFRYTASDEEEATGLATLDLGAWVAVDEVELRANACSTASGDAYDVDSDGYSFCASDCDDRDDSVHPGSTETCDDIDNNCDGTVDEGTSCYDDDGDGYTEDEGDCNDGDQDASPGQREIDGNGIDDDCDGVTDDGTVDLDGDGYSTSAGDCDDGDSSVYPGAPEAADGDDDDCDSRIDEGTSAYDDDGDGVTEAAGDCDDSDRTVYPGATEYPNWTDDDCDGTVDEGTRYYDDDGDGYSEAGGDCNDASAALSPGELEVVGDGLDNDCDGTTK